MLYNLLVFNLYIIIILIFLVIIGFFLSLDLLNIVYANLYLSYNISLQKVDNLNINQLQFYINAYIKKKNWFLCISMLEFYQDSNILEKSQILGYIAYCYKQMFYWEISQYYYLQALIYSPESIIILQQLADLYNILSNKKQAREMYERIISIDSNNILANKYLQSL